MHQLDNEIEQFLNKRCEGKLFIHIYLVYFSKTYSVIKDFYTVKNGKVYVLENEKETLSKDTLFDLTKDCVMVGKYNPNRKYKRIIKEYTYSEFKKLHKL